MTFEIITCKGTKSFTSTRAAAAWLVELQPGTHDVVAFGQRVEIESDLNDVSDVAECISWALGHAEQEAQDVNEG